MAFDASPEKNRDGLHRRAKDCLKRSGRAFLKQQFFLPYWQCLAEIFDPPQADFISERADGLDVYEGLFTSRPQILRRKLKDRIGTMTRPKGQQWFKLVVMPEERMEADNVKAWCDDSTKRQRNAVYAAPANFSRAMASADGDWGTYGNSVTRFGYREVDGVKVGVIFSAARLRDCAWAEDKEGKVNEMHEKMRLTLDQAAEMFGKKNLPRDWQDKLEQKDMGGTKVEVRRCVVPIEYYRHDDSTRPQYGEGEPRPRRDAKFASIYIAMGVDDKECGIEEGFFDFFPYSVRRWELIPGEVYARSPAAAVALADGRVLNIAEAALLKGIEMKVSPPRFAIDDGVVGEINITSDGVTYIDTEFMKSGEKPIDTLEVGEPKYAVEYVDRKNEEMAIAFFMDLLQLPDRQMTLGEFSQRFKIALRDAAPVFEPIEAEYSQMMEAVFDMMVKAKGPADPWGVFLPAPKTIQGSEFRYEFQTALTEAFNDLRRMEYKDFREEYLLLREAGDPAADNMNMDQAVRDAQANYPPKWTRPEKEVAAMRDERAAATQEQEAAEKTAALAEVATKAKPETLNLLKQEMEASQ